ncbi:MAG: ribose 5-phosphate isomerase B [Chloroflexi bacterium]|nr:ribose 5-phosphate isomerase B [Chloroflexota bacterium]
MKIALGSDHRGLEAKRNILGMLSGNGHACEDFGCYSADSVDYPDIARAVAEPVAGGRFDFGILVCGTGIGMSIAANKVRGVRAALCHNTFTAGRARQHNDANILCLSAEEDANGLPDIVLTFLRTGFDGGHHQRRLDKIKLMENS